MKNFFTGLMTYFTNTNSFNTAIGGRMFFSQAPENTVFPYCVYSYITGHPRFSYTEEMTEMIIQFSIFSSASSSGEVHDLMTALKARFDDCTFPVTSSKVALFIRGNEGLAREEYETPEGTQGIWHYHVDYDVTLNRGAT
jgi:hypothetical protein